MREFISLSEGRAPREPLELLDLRGVDLSDMYLEGANLASADLFNANLAGAYLRRADLSNVKLDDALLIDANFRGSSLRGVIARRSTATGASFVNVDLSGTNREKANLACAISTIRHALLQQKTRQRKGTSL